VLLLIDWLCLVKVKFILGAMSRCVTVFWSLVFVVVDLLSTLIVLTVIMVVYLRGFNSYIYAKSGNDFIAYFNFVNNLMVVFITAYFSESSVISLVQVALPSTMITSAWVALFFVSVILLNCYFHWSTSVASPFGGSRILMRTPLGPSRRLPQR
jgi:hypothetical protein